VKLLIGFYLFVAIILTQFFAAYFYSKGRTNYRKVFSAFILCVGFYLFGYLMILNNTNLQDLMFWNQIQYLGLPFISVLWLTVALLYNKTIYALSRPIAVFLFFIPVATFFIRLTNPWHHLFYKNMEVIRILGNYTLYLERGIWYYIHIFYTILCLLLTIIICLTSYLKKRVGYTRSQFFIFFFASLLPLIGIVLIVFTYNRWSIDFSALVIPISIFIIGFGILKCDFLEVKSLARETVFEDSTDGLMILESSRLIDYNRTARELFRAINISLDTYPLEHIFREEPELLEIFSSETAREFSLIINGEKRFYEVDAVPLGNIHEKKVRMLKTIRDITDKKRVLEKLTFLAATDSLTGLYNRTEFMKLAHKEFFMAKTHTCEELSLMMIDIDYFKNINDAYGHAAGDEVIREIGGIIRNSFRKSDFAGRLGGEEFVVLLKNTSLSEAERVAEKLREAVSSMKVIYEKQEISITVSIGVTATNDDIYQSGTIEDVLKQADAALYKAKAEGRNCVAVLG